MTHIKIVDMPCGYGKSTQIFNGFRKREKYIAVVPLLSEVDRFIDGAKENSGFSMTQPSDRNERKSDHCVKLIEDPLCQGSCPLLYFSSISQVGGIGR